MIAYNPDSKMDMMNKEQIPWKHFGFNGLAFDIPPTWDLVELVEENVGAYLFRFDEAGEMRLMVRSLRSPVRRFSPAKPTGRALAQIGKGLSAKYRKVRATKISKYDGAPNSPSIFTFSIKGFILET